jgi:hypothetical protein
MLIRSNEGDDIHILQSLRAELCLSLLAAVSIVKICVQISYRNFSTERLYKLFPLHPS